MHVREHEVIIIIPHMKFYDNNVLRTKNSACTKMATELQWPLCLIDIKILSPHALYT